MRILQTNFHGDHNLGLFGRATDNFCFVGNFVTENTLKKVKEVLSVEIMKATIANTDLLGIFSCANSRGVLLPNIVKKYELIKFKAVAKKFGLSMKILKTNYTALGNLILCNDHGAAISKIFNRSEKRLIEDCLDVEAVYGTLAKIDTVGSAGVATSAGCIVHRDATENEIKIVEDVLKVDVDIGTANFGSPFIGSCMIANKSGAVIGESTTGPEAQRIMETLELF